MSPLSLEVMSHLCLVDPVESPGVVQLEDVAEVEEGEEPDLWDSTFCAKHGSSRPVPSTSTSGSRR